MSTRTVATKNEESPSSILPFRLLLLLMLGASSTFGCWVTIKTESSFVNV
jgi:hypothetical protein